MLPLQIHRREKEVKRHYMAKNRISDLLVFFLYLRRSGIPNLGDAIGSQVVVFWVQLDQWGDVIDVWGDGEAKRLGTPALEQGVLNLGDAWDLKSVLSRVHLYQWGDATDVRDDVDTKGLEIPWSRSLWLCTLSFHLLNIFKFSRVIISQILLIDCNIDLHFERFSNCSRVL